MNQTVLIIDDSAPIHSLIRARLKDEPMVLHSATSGQQGLEMAAAIEPDLVLLDVEMPGLDGFEVCRRIKGDPKLCGIPVVFLIGAASTEHKLHGLEIGGADYINKPFDPAELRARVRAALRMKYMTDLLAQKAQIDILTGLWNRRYFDQRFEAELSLAHRAGRPLGVLMVDIDDFKAIHERFGHPHADHVLKMVAQRLSENIRLEDILCRFSGETFAVIAPNTTAGLSVLAERLRQVVEQMDRVVRGQPLALSVSIGGVSSESPSIELIAQAEEALYRAKRDGPNRIEILGPAAALSATAG